MKKSAFELGFKWNEDIEKIRIKGLTRVLLNKNGNFEVEYKKLPEIIQGKQKVKLGRKISSANPFLYHKTTIREAKPKDYFDIIGINERGEITEGTYTNIAIEKDGKLYTPPISCGLLGGTYREKLIETGMMEEKILYPDDLKQAEKIFCFNSVRKLVEVELCS